MLIWCSYLKFDFFFEIYYIKLHVTFNLVYRHKQILAFQTYIYISAVFIKLFIFGPPYVAKKLRYCQMRWLCYPYIFANLWWYELLFFYLTEFIAWNINCKEHCGKNQFLYKTLLQHYFTSSLCFIQPNKLHNLLDSILFGNLRI